MEASNSSSASLLQEKKENRGVLVMLPEPNKDDPLVDKKKEILSERSIDLVFLLHGTNLPSLKMTESTLLEDMITAARILQLDETEWYFIEDDDFGPLSPRNELEALNFIHSITCDLLHFASSEDAELLQALQDQVVDKIVCFANEHAENTAGVRCTGQAEMQLFYWAIKQGVKSKLNIAEFEGLGRGAMATMNLNVGDVAVEIPQSLIICEDTALRSDMRQVLENIDGLASETITLLWSMREHHNVHSEFMPYFAALPKSFNTGLSFGIDALTALEGTLLLEEIVQAKEHLRAQYESLCSTLFASNPEIFSPEFYTWDQFLWACELWYSNSMKVAFPDGKLKTCLVPVAGLLNHSLYPHVMRYSTIDTKTESLKLYVSRPCKSGQQCYLSYGPLPSSNLITFYGFLLKGDNPYDTIPIELDLPQQLDSNNQSLDKGCQISHMVRGTWLSKSQLNRYGLPSRLLAALRNAFLEEDDLQLLQRYPRLSIISKENEAAVLEAILSILKPMLDSMDETNEFSSEDCSWDVNLAMQFKDGQRRLITSICESCSSGLQALGSS